MATDRCRRTRGRVKLLRGEAGARQVEGARIGLTHVVRSGAARAVHILEKV